MIGLLVVGSFAAMCVLRGAANLIVRHGDRRAAAPSLADEAQAWLDRRGADPGRTEPG